MPARTKPMRRTEMKRSGAPKRSKAKARPKRSPNEFPDETKRIVRARSGGRCEAISKVCTGTAAHFHHRQSRKHKDQRPVNCLHVCSSCHDHIHAVDGSGSITKSRLLGWIVPSWADPADIPVKKTGNRLPG